MIKSKANLKFYLEEDRKRNEIPSNFWLFLFWLMAGREKAQIYRYIRCLRHCEYHMNNCGIIHKICYFYYRFRLTKLGSRYYINIKPNICGYGLRIMHLSGGGGVRLGAIKIGNYCGFNAGVIIGTNNGDANRPTLGDYVAFGPGAKAFGRITIGNNVFVAANSVVTKDVSDNCIVGGVPAKIIKYKEMV